MEQTTGAAPGPARTDAGGGSAAEVSATRRTVWVAFAANVLIALAKTAAGLLTGSSAMLAEAAHSYADTANQVFLRVSLSLGARPPDEDHPFGYGTERYFWAFVAALFIFTVGSLFSILKGVLELGFGVGRESGGFAWSYAVLGLALVAEGASLRRALAQTGDAARRRGFSIRRYLQASTDPTVRTVVWEDSAAVVGVLLAAAGVGLHQATGNVAWDAASSIAIGLLLAAVATGLGRRARRLLIGVPALPEERALITRAVLAREEVERIYELLTLHLGPGSLLVAMRVDFRAGIDSSAVERASAEIERDVRRVAPDAAHVFVDATAPGEVGVRIRR